MKYLHTILFFISLLTSADAQPVIVYDPPIYITVGGTYTGNWKSDDNTPAVLIFCYSPVTIINSNIKSSGNGIQVYGGGKVTVKYTNFIGQTPINNEQWGRAVNIYQPQTFVFEHNRIEHTGGIIVDHGNENTDSVSIKYNLIRNTDKRRVDGTEGDHRASILFNTVDVPQGVKGEIAWNRFENILDSSWIEDNINLGNVVATQARPFLIHDNYIKGAYPPSTYGNSSYTGSGITVEGEGGHNLATNVSQWIRIYNNQVISVCNGGININAGHDIHSYHNTIISSGLFPNGVQSYLFWGGRAIWNGSNVPYPSVFHDIDMIDDSVGYVRPGVNQPFTDRQDEVFVSGSPININSGASYHYPNPITLAKEVDQLRIFNLKVANNGFVIGNNTATPSPPPPAPFAGNRYYFSKTGNDAAAGTNSSAPWQSPSKFTTTIETTMAFGDSILFKRGDTFYGYKITNCPSGINIGAYGTGELPKISGLTSLTTWTNVGGNLWEASCNSGSNLDLVTVGGVTVPAGRTPNAGTYFNIDSHTNLSGGSANITSTSIPTSSQNWVGAQAVIRINAYNLDRDLITAHTGTTITYASPFNNKDIDGGGGQKFFIQKHPATLDVQNEWYYNGSTQVLRMYSTVNPSALNVQAATQNFFFNVDYRSDISFTNLYFSGLDSFAITGRLPLRFKFIGNTFEDIGTDAITLDVDSSCKILNNTFNRIGNSAIVARSSAHILVDNNNIDSCGVIKGMGLPGNQQNSGIMIETYSNDNRVPGDSTIVTNNRVTKIGYNAIRVLGTNFQVYNNFVDSFGLTLSDAGGVYTNGLYNLANQRIIRDNVILHGIGNNDMHGAAGLGYGGMPGVYLDDDTGNVDIYGNTVSGCSRYGIFLHNNKDINVYNNTIINTNGDAEIGIVKDGLGVVTVTNINVHDNNIYASSTSNIIYLYSFDNNESSFGTFYNNNYSKSTSSNLYRIHDVTYTASGWKGFGFDLNSGFDTASPDSIKLEFNATASASTVPLPATYIDLKGKAYAGNLVIAPYRSHLLVKKQMTRVTIPGKRKFIATNN